jgi:hypothetical protein
MPKAFSPRLAASSSTKAATIARFALASSARGVVPDLEELSGGGGQRGQHPDELAVHPSVRP